jgi:hypothetical protein
MISDTLPTTTGQIFDEIQYGIKTRSFSKTEVFDPALDITFTSGRHKINLPDGIYEHWGKLNLLHFKHIGREYYSKRSFERWKSWGFSDRMVNYRVNKGLRLMDGKLGQLQKVV